jgi:hypothetical protein
VVMLSFKASRDFMELSSLNDLSFPPFIYVYRSISC